MTMIKRLSRGLVVSALSISALSMAQEKPAVEHVEVDTGERSPSYTVVPLYPEKARRARVEGEVEVCFKVDRGGRISRVAVRRSTNRVFEKPSKDVFEKPSKDAVRLSAYHPLAKSKKLSGIKTCRTFRFYLTPVAIETPDY